MTWPLSPDRIAKGLYWQRAWSLVAGCDPVSAGCANCWAASDAHRMAGHPNPTIAAHNAELTRSDGRWSGTVRVREDLLDLPLRTRKPTVWSVWTDLFHEDVPDAFRTRVFDVIRRCATQRPGHVFLLLTKRAEALLDFSLGLYFWGGSETDHTEGLLTLGQAHPRQQRLLPLLDNAWFGVTVEDASQTHRLRALAEAPVRHRWLSLEPLLGPVDIGWWLELGRWDSTGAELPRRGIEWVVCGGESGRKGRARPVASQWVSSIRDQCAAAGVPFFFKQWGPKSAGRLLDRREHLALPGGAQRPPP